MLDIKFIRQNPDKVQWACEVKRIDLSISELLALDTAVMAARRDLEGLQKQRNDIAGRFKEQKTDADKAALTAEGRQVADRIAALQDAVSRQSEDLKGLLLRVPNIPHPDVPVGPDETHNRVVERVGTPREFAFKVRDHVELLELNGWAEFERLPKVSGSRSYALKGDMAVLEQSLLLMALKRLRPEGFEALTVPALVREQAFIGTGHFPAGRAEVYHLPADDLCA